MTAEQRAARARKASKAAAHVAPLLRFAADVDVAAETFTHKVQYQQVTGGLVLDPLSASYLLIHTDRLTNRGVVRW